MAPLALTGRGLALPLFQILCLLLPPAVPVTAASAAPRSCHPYRGSLHGTPMGQSFAAADVSACETACMANRSSCYGFVYTFPGPPDSLNKQLNKVKSPRRRPRRRICPSA